MFTHGETLYIEPLIDKSSKKKSNRQKKEIYYKLNIPVVSLN